MIRAATIQRLTTNNSLSQITKALFQERPPLTQQLTITHWKKKWRKEMKMITEDYKRTFRCLKTASEKCYEGFVSQKTAVKKIR